MMPSTSLGPTMSAKEAAARVRLPYHQLDAWARGDAPIVQPSIPSGGQGTRRRYCFRDLIALRVAAQLRKVGARSAVIRAAVAAVQNEVAGIDTPSAIRASTEAWVMVDAIGGGAMTVRTSAELKKTASLADPIAIVIDVADVARQLAGGNSRVFRVPKRRS